MASIHRLNTEQIQTPSGARAIGHTLLLEEDGRLVLIESTVGLTDMIIWEDVTLT